MAARAGLAIAGVVAAVLFLAALAWAFGVFAVAVNNYGEYCEDAGAACDPGDPVRVIAQAVIAAAGILALVGLATRLLRYALGPRPAEGLVLLTIVTVAAFVGWVVIVWGMRPLI